MRIAVTGADGFLGWHVRCRAQASGLECVPVRRDVMAEPGDLAEALRGVDAVIHCAGVNRGTESEVADGNVGLARRLATAVARADHPIRIVYANSNQSRESTVYGRSKRQAGDILACPTGFSDVILPNLYGEHGRPHYNSYVATFCRQLADGEAPRVEHDRELPMLHAQDAAQTMIAEAAATGHAVIDPEATRVTVSRVLELLRDFDSTYRTGELPDIGSGFRARLFNTYRSHLFPAGYPIFAPANTDARGTLVECVRTGMAGGQAFVSTTAPGSVRGEHFHLRKFERFLVVGGDVEIALRRLCGDEVVRFRVSGERPAIVDMPTMWAHKLSNVGDGPATTFFWTNELLRAEDPDTYPCPVEDLVKAA